VIADHAAPTSARATWAGLGAVALWAWLAALTVLSGKVPPFELTALAFAGGTAVGLVYALVSGQSLRALARVPLMAYALGIYGLLGYHVCYFSALKLAPPLEASLISYLWPLLIVVMAGALPASAGGKPLRWQHVVGALLGFAGTTLILLQKGEHLGFSGAVLGYVFALAAGVIWSSYSVLSRLLRGVPSIAVIGSCAGTTIGATLMHLWLETWVWPETSGQWLAILALGLGPLGLAFYLWDEGMKHGDLLRLGLASYATPLLSTFVLAMLGLGILSPMIAIAALLVTAGAVVAGLGAQK
jgi:drug/metabolite transporter (DMT)-like permease